MLSVQSDVRAFHADVCGKTTPLMPIAPDQDLLKLRRRLNDEEFAELNESLNILAGYRGDDPSHVLADVTKEACDLIYVVVGMLDSFGIDMEPVWRAVQMSNMAKAGGTIREDGKRLKPIGWQPPRIQPIIRSLMEAAT